MADVPEENVYVWPHSSASLPRNLTADLGTLPSLMGWTLTRPTLVFARRRSPPRRLHVDARGRLPLLLPRPRSLPAQRGTRNRMGTL